MEPDNADASNSLGALLAQSGDVPAAIERFRAALQARPDFADALNNLGFALFQTGQAAAGVRAVPEGAGGSAGLSRGAEQPRHLLRPAGDLEASQRYFQQALEQRADYGEAANNLALVLAARGDPAAAVGAAATHARAGAGVRDDIRDAEPALPAGGPAPRGDAGAGAAAPAQPEHPLGLQMLRELGGGM